MMRIDDVRKKAAEILPTTEYVPYADSPTIKSYTDWNAFESAFSSSFNAGVMEGASSADAIPSFSFEVGESRALAHHFSRIPSFFLADSDRIVSFSKEGHTAQHILLCADTDRHVLFEDRAISGSKSLTVDVFVRPGVSLEFGHLVQSSFPHYVYIRVHLGTGSSFSGRLAVIGKNTHVRYRVFLNGESSSFSLSGASISGKSDVVTDAILMGERARATVSYVLLSGRESFLVHRGVLRVERSAKQAYADMDSAFLTTGGFAASVPELEVLTDNVVHVAHRSRDLSLGDEQMFYLRSRGLSMDDAMLLYVYEVIRSRIGSLSEDKAVKEALRAFSESLQL